MEKNYYPLRVGKELGVIVSDVHTRTYVNKTDEQSEIKHYGGHFICEAVISQTLAKQLVDAYNKIHGCTHADKPCTGGQLCCQWKISHHDWVEQEIKINPDSHDFQSGMLFRKQEENDKIKSLIGTSRLVDVVKVIEDLESELRRVCGIVNSSNVDTLIIPDQLPAIQNAQAALGMLQAFKERHIVIDADENVRKWSAEEVYNYMKSQPLMYKPTSLEEKLQSSPHKDICRELTEFQSVFLKMTNNIDPIQEAAKMMISCIKSGGKIISIGNGGSYSDAQHFASELSGKYRGVRPAIAAMALSDGGAMSCIANDFGYSQVFKRQIEALAKEGDILLALSTSGNSENILVAAERAKMLGVKVVGISGNGGGKLKDYTDVMIEIPHSGSADRVQEMTIIIIHILVGLIERL